MKRTGNSVLFILVLTLFSMGSAFCQEATTLRTVSGTVTHNNLPIENIHVRVLGSNNGVKTNQNGEYMIATKEGDIINFSHVSYKSLTIVVEDVTSVLNLEMHLNVNQLEETVVKARRPRDMTMEKINKKNQKFKTAYGTLNPRATGFSVPYIDGDEISNVYPTIADALSGKFAGGAKDPVTGKFMIRGRSSILSTTFPIWDIDGLIFEEEPTFLDLDNIASIHILKSYGTTAMYGALGSGGVVVIRTKFAANRDYKEAMAAISDDIKNQDTYREDAVDFAIKNKHYNAYTKTLQNFNDATEAYSYYNTIQAKIVNYGTHIDIAHNFIDIYGAKEMAQTIINDLVRKHYENPEILKALAYEYQSMRFKKEAISAYERIYKLRSDYAQSYRDLANAYSENHEYRRAWKMYMAYLLQGEDLSDEGIGQMLYNEMEYLYFNRSNQTGIKQTFVPKHTDVHDFRNDVRIVFEWNTSEAEFDLEFVGPDKRVYNFEHTLAANQELITDEKLKGYSSREFMIDDIGEDEWLVNLTYRGNKKSAPTYFKITTYYNWGKPNQRQDIDVYKLHHQRNKLQLKKINKSDLIAVN